MSYAPLRNFRDPRRADEAVGIHPGVPLAGLSVKVASNFFLISLSSAEADMQRNVELLREQSWFDLPIVYDDGHQAIIAVEKGASGERAFSEGFAAWEE